MKLLFTLAAIFSMLSLQAEETLKIYLCSRLTKAAKEWNNEVTNELADHFILFRPQDVDIDYLPPIEKDLAAYTADLSGMQGSDLLLVLPPYGRDCAWEIGWFGGKDRPTIAYAEIEGDWLNDAMVKGGLTAIVTNNPALYERLLMDPETVLKCYLIPSKKELGDTIKKICLNKG